MSRAEQIYPLQKMLERELARVESDPHNRAIMTRYYKVRSSEIRLATQVINFLRLNEMSKLLDKKFEEAMVEDIENLVFAINQKHKNANTQNKYRKILRHFFRWMRGFPKNEFPPEVKWITLNEVPLVNVRSEDLLSYGECVKITECATNPRDRALFQCKLDAGCRIGEILTVKMAEVRFNDAGAVLYSEGKTGYQPIILTWSAKNLGLWINIHPFRQDGNAPLWIEFNRREPRQLSYASARVAFKKCVERAGYKRRVWLHLLKHVSSTEDFSNGMPDSFRRYKHHWTQSSRMPEVYEHLSQSMIPKIQQDTWRRLSPGSLNENETMTKGQEATLELIRTCKRCEFQNPRDSKFCNRCGLILDDAELARTSIAKAKGYAFIDGLAEDPKKLEKFLSMIP